jgi:hypothetical protein
MLFFLTFDVSFCFFDFLLACVVLWSFFSGGTGLQGEWLLVGEYLGVY